MLDFNEISILAVKIKANKELLNNNKINFDTVIDSEAEILFNKIDETELNNYLKGIIREAINNKDNLVEHYYNNKIDEFFSNYLSSEIDAELDNFKKEISLNKRNDKSIFNRAYHEANANELTNEDAISFIARKVQDCICSAFRYKNKVVELNNFEEEMKNSIIFNILFDEIEERELFRPTALEKLFINRGDFHNVKNLLLQKGYLLKNNGEYYWQGSIRESDLSSKKLICTLGLILSHKNYLKSNNDTEIVNALTNFFVNQSITKTIYGRYRKEYEDLDQRNQSLYYKFYFFIPKKNNSSQCIQVQ